MIKQVQILIDIYFDPDGNRTCALDFRTGKVCKFYRTKRMGTYETCVFAPNEYRYDGLLNRRESNGALIPGEWCPLTESELPITLNHQSDDSQTNDDLKTIMEMAKKLNIRV